MKLVKTGLITALLFSTAIPVFAQSTDAIAATDLNVRSGPGPQYSVVGLIPGGEVAMVQGCLDTASWCQVTFGETSGWASSDYLAVNVEEQAIALTTRPAEITVNSVTYEDLEGTEDNQREGLAVGATLGVLAGVAVGGPIGGIVAGGILGGAAGSAVAAPDEKTVTYITSNPVETVYLDGEVVVGAGVPSTVPTFELPQAEYRYVNINGQTVIVDAETNAIVRVIR
ncbi:DUF1236 domain-containing protein [Sulfitobacter guttiformis]|uniref:Uncharacterized protein YraI n=1 Tax=Sulfitobacter guttiformis TaxID=74349 RepID=A0A420DMK4_9RHOB|nr:DUF1236 domain-containing protein [Sulfitobacter guttiformis]KIN72778.1 hypothetical protein Z949_1957 [Sulfitobacter guttiformis KCTC 32187]RKE95472.1 uncharacterized protein YraI [Sulfitobacter guttiformis]